MKKSQIACIFLIVLASNCFGATYERKIEAALASLQDDTNQPKEALFHSFVMVASKRSERFVQFSKNEKGIIELDIPIAHIYDEDGERKKQTFLNSETMELIGKHLAKWKIEFRDSMAEGLDIEDLSHSGFRRIQAEILIDPADCGEFVVGFFTDCFKEEGPLDLLVKYEPAN
ncbi:MAG: hypothetical protein ACSHX8_10220 [Opitutaceae bacterium]